MVLHPLADYPDRAGRALSLAKNLIFFLYLYSGYVQLRDLVLSRLGRARAVVVYYHRVGGRDAMARPADEFRRDIAFLSEEYDCVSLGALCGLLRVRAPLRRRTVAVTFDDGYRDNFTEACPVLLEAGVPATFFVATGFVGTHRAFPHDRPEPDPVRPADFPKLTWDELRQMESWGFEVGSHTVNHTNLALADAATAAREIKDSLDTLNRELGERPRAFSFPWGGPQDIPPAAVEMLKGAGYYAGVSAYGGVNRRGSDPFEIRRVDVGNGNLSRLGLRARVAGFDPHYWLLEVTRKRVTAPSRAATSRPPGRSTAEESVPPLSSESA